MGGKVISEVVASRPELAEWLLEHLEAVTAKVCVYMWGLGL